MFVIVLKKIDFKFKKKQCSTFCFRFLKNLKKFEKTCKCYVLIKSIYYDKKIKKNIFFVYENVFY